MIATELFTQSPYLTDILDQPAALERTIQVLQRLEPHPLDGLMRQGHARQIVLTGMGSSFSALYPLWLRLLNARRCAILIETAELIHSAGALLDEDTLVVAVSQSGRSAETVQLLSGHANGARVIGVTNELESPLAQQAAFVVPLAAGTEHSVSCKTYLASLAGLCWLGDQLSGDGRSELIQLAHAADLIATYLDKWQTHVTHLLPMLDGCRTLFFTGRGTSLAAVGTGALILKESVRFPAEGMSSASFRHGPMEMAQAGVAVFVYQGTPDVAALNQRLVAQLNLQGAHAQLIGPDSPSAALRLPNSSDACRVVLEILPAQMISLTIAANQQVQPGQFVHASKVTTIE